MGGCHCPVLYCLTHIQLPPNFYVYVHEAEFCLKSSASALTNVPCVQPVHFVSTSRDILLYTIAMYCNVLNLSYCITINNFVRVTFFSLLRFIGQDRLTFAVKPLEFRKDDVVRQSMSAAKRSAVYYGVVLDPGTMDQATKSKPFPKKS